MPQLTEKNETNEFSNFSLGVSRESAYQAYVAHNGDLVFSYQKNNEIKNSKNLLSIRFLPEEAENLVKGLIYQSAAGLGRTSKNHLLNILTYRYSKDFTKNQKT